MFDAQLKTKREEELGSMLDKMSSLDGNESPLRKDTTSKTSKTGKKLIKEYEFFDFSIDLYENFRTYFPHNNLKNVLRKINLNFMAPKSVPKMTGNFSRNEKQRFCGISKRLFKASKESLIWCKK